MMRQLDDGERAANLLRADALGGSISVDLDQMERDCERVTKQMKDYDKVKVMSCTMIKTFAPLHIVVIEYC